MNSGTQGDGAAPRRATPDDLFALADRDVVAHEFVRCWRQGDMTWEAMLLHLVLAQQRLLDAARQQLYDHLARCPHPFVGGGEAQAGAEPKAEEAPRCHFCGVALAVGECIDTAHCTLGYVSLCRNCYMREGNKVR